MLSKKEKDEHYRKLKTKWLVERLGALDWTEVVMEETEKVCQEKVLKARNKLGDKFLQEQKGGDRESYMFTKGRLNALQEFLKELNLSEKEKAAV